MAVDLNSIDQSTPHQIMYSRSFLFVNFISFLSQFVPQIQGIALHPIPKIETIILYCKNFVYITKKKPTAVETRGRIFSHVRPFYERAVHDLDPQRSMHRPV
jgi:hypothetical protein